MSDDTFDLYLIEDPNVIYGDPDGKLRGFLSDLLAYYYSPLHITMPVTDTADFVCKVLQQVRYRIPKKIRTLVIGSHGGPDHFYLGKDMIDLNPKVTPPERISILGLIAPYFAKDAKVLIST
jgi:hypothetical protein